jgi:hypothetical protein
MPISFRLDRHDAKLGSAPTTHCADLLTARENLRCCNVRSCQKKCDKALYYLTTDRGAPCALYPAITWSTSCAPSIVRHSPTDCDQVKIGKSITRADPRLRWWRRYACPLLAARTPEAIEAVIRSRCGGARDLQFGRRKATGRPVPTGREKSGIVDSGRKRGHHKSDEIEPLETSASGWCYTKPKLRYLS